MPNMVPMGPKYNSAFVPTKEVSALVGSPDAREDTHKTKITENKKGETKQNEKETNQNNAEQDK